MRILPSTETADKASRPLIRLEKMIHLLFGAKLGESSLGPSLTKISSPLASSRTPITNRPSRCATKDMNWPLGLMTGRALKRPWKLMRSGAPVPSTVVR